MKIKCDNLDLARAIGIAMRAVPSKANMQICESVLIEATNKGISVTANDMQMGIETCFDGDVKEVGAIAVDAKLLNDISRKLPRGDVEISASETLTVKIRCGRSKFEIPGQDAEVFPRLPEPEQESVVTVDQESFKNAILNTIFCVAQTDRNVIMTGEYIEVKDDVMRISALDGSRVATVKIHLAKEYGNIAAIVPAKTMSEVSKILRTGDMQVGFAKDHVIFSMENTTLVSRVIDGEYFNVDKILANDHKTIVKADAYELLSCIGRASVVVESSQKRPVIINISDEVMNIDVNTQRGATHEELAIQKDGADLLLGMNGQFLSDAIKAASFYDEEVEIRFINAKSPATIEKVDSDYRYIVLPVSIRQGDTENGNERSN